MLTPSGRIKDDFNVRTEVASEFLCAGEPRQIAFVGSERNRSGHAGQALADDPLGIGKENRPKPDAQHQHRHSQYQPDHNFHKRILPTIWLRVATPISWS